MIYIVMMQNGLFTKGLKENTINEHFKMLHGDIQ